MADFAGKLDEPAVYNQALTQSRIASHYDTAKAVWGKYPIEILEDHPVGYWRLDDFAGSIGDNSGPYDIFDTLTTDTRSLYTFAEGLPSDVTISPNGLVSSSYVTMHRTAERWKLNNSLVTVKVTMGSSVTSWQAGLTVRMLDNLNWMWVAVFESGGAFRIQYVFHDNGVDNWMTGWWGPTIIPNATYWLRLKTQGNLLNTEVWDSPPSDAGTPIATTSDYTIDSSEQAKFGFTTAGYCGLHATWASATYRDLTIHSLDQTPGNSPGTVTGTAKFRQPGALSNQVSNQISLIMREFPLDPVTQLDLNSDGIESTSQAQLEGLGHQPNYGPADFLPREQKDLDILTQASLDRQPQGQIERIKDTMTEDWLEARFEWNSHSCVLTITNRPEDLIYTFEDIHVITNQDHTMLVDLEDNSIRVKIYQLDGGGNIQYDKLVYDSTEIIDPSLIRRRRGRVGWYPILIDGDANIQNVRTRGLSYGEVYSLPFESITPVSGATLFATSTPNRELFRGLDPGPFGGTIDTDTTKSNSGKAFKITNQGKLPFQGVQTVPIYIDEWPEIEISFDLWLSQTAINNNEWISAFLISEKLNIIELNLARPLPDRWTPIQIRLNDLDKYETGYYWLTLVQSMIASPQVWFIDNISIQQRAVAWAGRANDDFWDGQWQDFYDNINTMGGILFSKEGNKLQYRGKALRHNSEIHELKTQPLYAQPSRFVWTDEDILYRQPPTAVIDWENNFREVTFSGYGSYAATGGEIISWYWTFGDGQQDAGPTPVHEYPADDTYTATLTVTDDEGNQSQAQAQVVVTGQYWASLYWAGNSTAIFNPWKLGQTLNAAISWHGSSAPSISGTRIVMPPVPVITSLNPNHGPIWGDTSVEILGTGFTGTTNVKFGTKRAETFSRISDTEITAESPESSGVVDVRVTAPGGTSAITPADQFTYDAPWCCLLGRGCWIWEEIWEAFFDFDDCREAKMQYVNVKCMDGLTAWNTSTISSWIDQIRGAGFKVVLWGYLYGNNDEDHARAEADFAADLCEQYGADAFVADAEIEYEQATRRVSWAFCDHFRFRLPQICAGLSSFGRPSFHFDLDWDSWIDYDFCGMPQAYWNDSDDLHVETCVNDYRSRGFSKIAPTIAYYPGALGRPSSTDLATSLSRVPAWSTWEVNHMTSADFSALGSI